MAIWVAQVDGSVGAGGRVDAGDDRAETAPTNTVYSYGDGTRW